MLHRRVYALKLYYNNYITITGGYMHNYFTGGYMHYKMLHMRIYTETCALRVRVILYNMLHRRVYTL